MPLYHNGKKRSEIIKEYNLTPSSSLDITKEVQEIFNDSKKHYRTRRIKVELQKKEILLTLERKLCR